MNYNVICVELFLFAVVLRPHVVTVVGTPNFTRMGFWTKTNYMREWVRMVLPHHV